MNELQKKLTRMIRMKEQAAVEYPDDPWRLGFHLMPPVGWLNDPNGLCYFRGEYHVFFQYAPFDPNGSTKFWGHYKSSDMLSWEYCPVALYSDQPYDLHGVYSGSALCEPDGLYLYYTGNVKYDGDYDYIRSGRESNTVVAYLPDGVHLEWKRLLMTNMDYPTGLSLHVRDPKVWKQDYTYYMVQGARTSDNIGEVLVFESKDQFHWKHINTLRTPIPFGYMWECPDLFQIDGQWILLVCPQGTGKSGPGFENQYACGYFPLYGDFRSNISLGEFVPLDYGFDFYAPQTFCDGNRRLIIGWMGMPDAEYSNPTTERGWQHCLSQVREVRYLNGKLLLNPIREIERLWKDSRKYTLSARTVIELPHLADITISCDERLTLQLSGLTLKYENGNLVLSIQSGGYGRNTRTAPVKELRQLRILMDTSSIEIFVNNGESVLSTRWYPESEKRTLTISGAEEVIVHDLHPMIIMKYQNRG